MAHRGTRPLWGGHRIAPGAAAVVEGSSLPYRRDRADCEEDGACFYLMSSSSRLSAAAAAAPQCTARGSNWRRRMCLHWWRRCSRVWLSMGRYRRGTARGAEPEKGPSRGRKWLLGLRAFLLLSLVCSALLLVCLRSYVAHLLRRPRVPGWNATLSILVQHEDAPQRMRLTYSQKVKWIHLPSWTLRVVPANCEDCLDSDTYAAAVQRAAEGLVRMQSEDNARQLAGLRALQHPGRHFEDYRGGRGPHLHDGLPSLAKAPLTTVISEEFLMMKGGPYAVFANVGAPLGRIGPMLYAMRSVTDGIDVAAELPHWRWLQHTSISSPAGAVRPPPYIAVMGIPSADTTSHAQLRDAQRSTWFHYTAVARRENHFQGRLLPLYIFAAPERKAAPDPTWIGQDEDTGPAAAAEFFRPTAQEFSDATNFYHALSAQLSRGGTVPGDFSYRQRRMSLRPQWRTSDLTSSPCGHATSSTVRSGPGNPRPPLAVLADYLRLPVIPAFTAATRFLCEASSGLWLEALQHGNSLWIDMLTDRIPTAEKGGAGSSRWGMATAVGMTQKTVLWLEYAYHAFPGVPFIAKSYDDTYIKVPQMMSDFAYVVSGRRHRHLDASSMDDDSRAPATAGVVGGESSSAASRVRLAQSSESECVYWGQLGRQSKGVPYFVGVHYSMTRKVARVVLEKPRETYGVNGLQDVLRLSMLDFNPIFADIYTRAAMTEEDRFIGKALHDGSVRAAQLCPNERITYIEEGLPRFHGLQREVRGTVTWASVVAHYCTPAEMFYLHKYYFVEEHRVRGGATPAEVEAAEKAAQERGAQWILANMNASLDPSWVDLQPMLWVSHGARPENAKARILFIQDGVAVYNITLTAWNHDALRPGGLMTVPHVKVKRDGDTYPVVE
ncbi:hypothetical protein Q4I32_000765 [Leishmania shawi]|uniref:Phosphoglycan beta 1,3 galactosyltransferase n=1 Tax=Leishmania shawi TaxID=5680 RepID=A0AAW3C9V5_9TRYP